MKTRVGFTPPKRVDRVGDWCPDTCLDGFEKLTLDLPDVVPAKGEPNVVLTATLVRACAPRRSKAILYIHGWNDYFFQTHLARACQSMGYDFYALDLHRYGRNLVPGLLAGYVPDLAEYDAEISESVRIIREQHDVCVLMGHSTGGLISSLWVSAHVGDVDGLILNAPWLAMWGAASTWAVMKPIIKSLAVLSPTRGFASPGLSITRRAMWEGAEGEWSFVLDLKTSDYFITRPGWLAAVFRGQEQVERGLSIDVPILCLTSTRSAYPVVWDEAFKELDFVLDVEKICEASLNLGNHLTVVRVEGAVHDVVLSKPAVRQVVFEEMENWLKAYVEHESAS